MGTLSLPHYLNGTKTSHASDSTQSLQKNGGGLQDLEKGGKRHQPGIGNPVGAHVEM